MVPGQADITIYQGDTFNGFMRLRTQNPDGTPGAYIDLTGAVGLAQIRPDEASAVILADFTVTLADQVALTGGVFFTLAPADTTALNPGQAMWDIQLTLADGTVNTYLKGVVTVEAEVSR